MQIASLSRAVARNGYTGSRPTTRESNPGRAVSGSGDVTTADSASASGQGVIPAPDKPAFSLPTGETFPIRSAAAEGARPTAGQTDTNLRLGTPDKPAFSLPSGETFPIRSAAAEGPRPTAGQTDTNLRLGTPDRPAFSLPTGETFPIRSAAQQPGSLLDVQA